MKTQTVQNCICTNIKRFQDDIPGVTSDSEGVQQHIGLRNVASMSLIQQAAEKHCCLLTKPPCIHTSISTSPLIGFDDINTHGSLFFTILSPSLTSPAEQLQQPKET